MTFHKAVLLEETVGGLNLKDGSVAVDATLGGGGHSLKILESILPHGHLIAIDRDQEAIERFRVLAESLKPKLKEENVDLVHDNFSNLKEILASLGIEAVDAIMADFGISSDQLEDGSRGFSFQKEGELDMRMDRSKGITAREVVNTYSQEDLIRILKEYGEEENALKIAKAIVAERGKEPIRKTLELARIVESAVPKRLLGRRINVSTKTFQALRIEVNRELESIERFVQDAIGALRSGGRLAVISFHSGEDSIVKKVFRENARGCICPPSFPVCRCGKVPSIKIIKSKPISPSEKEKEENPRSRSAKLRIAEKI